MLAMQSCLILPGKGKNSIVFNLKNQPKKVAFNPSLASIDIANDIVTINGSGFTKVTEVKIQGTGVDVGFNLDSLSDSKIIASAKSALSLLVGSTFNLIISSAEASSTFPITFTLSDGVVTNTKLHSMGATNGQVLQFNGTNWLPTSIASPMLFIGMWDASSGSPTAGAYSAGDYFIVSGAGSYGTDNYVVGDWAVYDGADWNRVFTDTGTKLSKTGGTLTGDLILDTQALFKGGANYVTLKASAGLASDITLTLPTSVGTNGQVLTTNGSGVLSWETVASGGGTGAVYSVNSQTGTVTLTTSDIAEGTNQYFTTARALSAVTASLATKQSVDTTLTALAAYNTNGILVQTAADTFVGRTLTGAANRLTVTDGNGVAGDPTINLDTTLLPSPVLADVGKYLKATAANASVWTALSSSDITTALGFTPINKAGDTISSGTFTFDTAAVLRTLDPVGLTDVANKQYVDAAVAAVGTASNTWTASGSDVYRSSGNVGIGTTNPTGTFEVQGGTAAANTGGSDMTFVAQSSGAGGSTTGGGFNFTTGAGTGGWSSGSMNINLGVSNGGQIIITRGRGGTYTATGTGSSGGYPAATIRNSNSTGGDAYHFIESLSVKNAALNPQSGYFGVVAVTGAGNYTPAFVWGSSTGSMTYVERMRIDQNGNVGIGTTAPTASLTVSGEMRALGSSNGYVGFKAAATTSSTTYTWPTSAGTNGYVLTTDGTGTLTWTAGSGAVSSVNSQTGTVTLTTTDIAEGTNQYFSDARAQSALTASLATKQNIDATLTALSGFNTNGILVQTAPDTFVGRTLTGTANRITVTNGDGVSGSPTINLDTTLLPSPVLADVGKFLKVTAADTSVWTALGSSDVTTALGFTPLNKAGDTMSGTLTFTSGNFTIGQSAFLIVPNPVISTDAVNKQYVDGLVGGTWTASGSDVYRASGSVGIGTATPSVALDVNGQINAKTLTVNASTTWHTNFDSTGDSVVTVKAGGGTRAALYLNGRNSSNPWYMFTGGSDTNLYFMPSSNFNASNKVMTLTSGGNLGIGTGVSTLTASLTVAGTASISGQTTIWGFLGLGTASPRANLDVSGTILTKAATSNAGATIDFSTGNLQYTSNDCGAFQFNNMKDGGNYTFAVKGTNSTTCSFTAYSDAGISSLTVHLPPDHAATTATKHTIYSLVVIGADVYISWIPGY